MARHNGSGHKRDWDAYELVRVRNNNEGYQITCANGCGQTAVIERTTGKRMPPDVLKKRFTRQGWRPKGNGFLCPDRDCKRAPTAPEDPIIEVTQDEEAMPQADAPRAADMKAQLKIMRALDEVFDADKGQYLDGKSDDLIARDLNFPRAWVVEVREEAFGPLKISPELMVIQRDMAALGGAIDKLEIRITNLMEEHERLTNTQKALVGRLDRELAK